MFGIVLGARTHEGLCHLTEKCLPPQVHLCEPEGDILVFLTGEQEIEDACRKTKQEIDNLGEQVATADKMGCTPGGGEEERGLLG